jgi:arginyl-tRNA synthetase
MNITFTTMVWDNILSSILHPSEEKIGSGKTIVVDYIGMNVGKPPHIGHICTPLQGQSIINMMRYFGYTVIGDSHLGDWGSLFGKLIVGYKTYGNEEKLTLDAIDHLLEIYVKINTDCEANPDIEQSCRDAFRELANGNPEYTTLWATFTRASITTAKHMLQMMHIKQDYDIGESFYE